MNILKKLEQQAPDLAFELPDGKPVVRLGLIFTVYFKQGYTSETKGKLLECFRRFYDEHQKKLKCLVYGRHKKLTAASFEKAQQAILASGGNEEFSLFLGSAPNDTEAAEYSLSALNSFEVHGDKLRSYIKLVMPWNVLLESDGLSRFQEWATYLCDQVNAEHGYGGLSSILPYDYHSYIPTEYQLAQQYSGLEVDSMPHASSIELLEAVKGVNWFTVLGTYFVNRLGGEAVLRQAFSGRGDIEILTYSNGLIVKAGEYPQLGRLEDGPPPSYVAVNKIIKQIRIQHPDQLHPYSPYGNAFEEESTSRWYARFDQDDDQSKTPARLEAGQPCTVAGYWFTPAQANSRRHFQQGEIMPRISDSTWGDTIWYWSGES
ncbi:type VI immunity family protein [Pseudomonas cichorii]|uniref:type VI immunity family protein n=1 Tax=Pseudomonas cichorii TaxID=36746 RepID=UPI001C892442|nr:type VI immunity family protein [Pseudomonas cichorii]MBX8488038.1 DUF3396 domain-containing protein [Pseudomonas cichorii]MBX8575210.1 DUF3396 domain-containing protein [Pseudomonas cichorii]